jgi:hypothetical protein
VELAASLDAAERDVDEWGSISMSAPLLAMPDPMFEFNLSDVDAKWLFNSALNATQARSTLITRQTWNVNVEGAISTEATQGASENGKIASAPNQAGADPTSLPPDDKLMLPSRTALLIAAGDYTTKTMLNLFGNAAQLARFDQRPVLYAVSTVSVQPGWRTEQGYAAEIQLQPKYSYENPRPEYVRALIKDVELPCSIRAAIARNYPELLPQGEVLSAARIGHQECTKNHQDPDSELVSRYASQKELDTVFPTATVISPLIDAQAIDGSDLTRQAVEFSLRFASQLRSANLAHANAFTNLAKEFQAEIAMRDANVAVSTYNYLGGVVGFEIGPRIAAVTGEDGQHRHPRLGRQAFPILMMLAFDRAELGPTLACSEALNKVGSLAYVDGNRSARVVTAAEARRAGTMRCSVSEPALRVETTPRWKPLERNAQTLSVQERAAALLEIHKATNRIKAATEEQSWGGACNQPTIEDVAVRRTQGMLLSRARALRQELNGGYAVVGLPTAFLVPSSDPAITAIAPTEVNLERDQRGRLSPKTVEFAISGENLDAPDVARVKLASGHGTIASTFLAGQRHRSVITARVRVTAPGEPLLFDVPLTDGTHLYAPAVPVRIRSYAVSAAGSSKDKPPGE